MSNCDCCGCTETVNYRNQRVAPSGVTFAEWCNANREFVLTDNVQDDYDGPWSITTGGGWVDADPVFFLPSISGGTLTLNGVYANVVSCFIGGGAQISGSGAIAAWGQQLSAVGAVPIPSEQWSFFPITPFVPVRRAARLSFDGRSLLKLAGPSFRNEPYALERYSPLGLDDDSGGGGHITARSLRGGLTSFSGYTGSTITHAFSVTPATAPTGWVYANYFRGPVRLQGAKGSLYRNGQLVWEATRPQPSASESHTGQDGVYLWMSEVLEAADPPYTGAGRDERIRVPSPLKRVQSFVVDTDPPVIGVAPPCDYFEDELANVDGQRPYLVATKPIRGEETGGPQVELTSDSVEDVPIVRPLYVPRTGGGFNGNWYSDAAQAYVGNLAVGLHSVKARVRRTNFNDLSTYRDYPGNSSASVPTFSLRVHSVPANNRRGARPVLEDVGLQTAEYGRARLQSEQVAKVRLRFDRVVDPATVSANQISLTKDGAAVGGCTIQQLSATDWQITLPNPAEQTPKSFWVLTYDPAGQVLTDDVDEIAYPTYDDFPPASQSVYRRAYVATDTGKRYCKSPAGYVEIQSGPPTDENGVPFGPEPSLLAYRISWLMASSNGWLIPQDTSSEIYTLGEMLSISKQIDSLPPADGTFSITSTGGVITDWGAARLGNQSDGFTPCVPPQSDWPTDCSYWGLTTTIDPCPPKTLRCPVAKSPQRHASILRREQELESFTLSLIRLDATTNEEVAPVPGSDVELFDSATLSKTAYGENLPQNCWYTSLPPSLGFPVTEFANYDAFPRPGFWGRVYKDLETGARYSWANMGDDPPDFVAIGGGNPIDPDGNEYDPPGAINRELWLAASRKASEYPGLKTTMLWELDIEAFLPLQIRRIDPVTGAVSIVAESSRSRIVLSRDKEDEWNNDQTFYVVSRAGGGTSFNWWKFGS